MLTHQFATWLLWSTTVAALDKAFKSTALLVEGLYNGQRHSMSAIQIDCVQS